MAVGMEEIIKVLKEEACTFAEKSSIIQGSINLSSIREKHSQITRQALN